MYFLSGLVTSRCPVAAPALYATSRRGRTHGACLTAQLRPWLSRLTRWVWSVLLVVAVADWALWLRVQHRSWCRPYLGGAGLAAGRDVHAGICDVCVAARRGPARPGLNVRHRLNQCLHGLSRSGEPVLAVEPLAQCGKPGSAKSAGSSGRRPGGAGGVRFFDGLSITCVPALRGST